MEPLVIAALSFLFGVFITYYLGGYSKKKGENLATHEDIDKLVDQVSAVTATAKEIEAKISDEMWNRQKQWELRRDVLFEMARKAGRETEAMSRLYAVYNREKINVEKGLPARTEKRVEVGAAWNDAAADFEGMQMLVTASCGPELVSAVSEFGLFMRALSREITEGKPEAFDAALKEFAAKSHSLSQAIRKELEISVTK
jgi:hypothetical protein